MNANEVIERLCVLQQEVVDRHIGYENGSDCFCGKADFGKAKDTAARLMPKLPASS